MNKILLSLAVIGIVGGTAVGLTTAYFSDTETSTGNTISAGTIDISVDESSVWNKTYTDQLTDMKPGQVRYINFIVKNTGENPARVWKHLGEFVTATGTVSEPECTDQSGVWSDGLCGTFVDNNEVDNVITYDMYVCKIEGTGSCAVDSNGKPIDAGWNLIINDDDGITIGDMESAWIDLLEWRPSQKDLQSGEELKVSQSYYMQPTAGNEYQGDTLTFNIDLKAQQINAPEIRGGTLLMENKDAQYNIIKGDGIWGVLKFNTSGPSMNYSFNGYVPDKTITYKLVWWNDATSGPEVLIQDGLNADPTTGKLNFTGSYTPPSSLNSVKIWLRPSTWVSEAFNNARTLWDYNLIDFAKI